MKKNLLLTIICVLGLFGSLSAQKAITLGEGKDYSSDLPYNNSWCYSASQQLYRSDELNIEDVAKIESVAFKSASENLNESYIQIYMKNTSKSSYIEAAEWVPVTANDKVYEGYIHTTGLDEWSTIELTTPFIYTGGHILVCVNIGVEYYLSSNEQDQFYTYSPSTTSAYSCTIRSNERIDIPNVPTELLENGSVGPQKNQIKFVYSQKKEKINANFESIDMGEVVLGEYWTEREDKSVIVSAASYYTKLESVTCSDSFFVLSEIDYNASPLQFVVSYDKNATAGEKSAEIIIKDEDGAEVVIPITATAYTPVEPDVVELAKEVTFTDGVYTDKPDFATLHDDYLLPNENLLNIAPDAVYSLQLEEDALVLVDVEGKNSKFALYAEDFGANEGPTSDNVVTGEETIIATTFSYDFEDGKLDDFIIEDYDEFKDYTWTVEGNSENHYLTSYSYKWLGDDPLYINDADERIITKTAYPITPNSVLTFQMTKGEYDFEEVLIEVTKDGENFIEIEKVTYHDYTMNWKSCRVDMGVRFATLGIEYGEYQIVLHHDLAGVGQIVIDNLSLTERTNVVPAGSYYLVVAAEDAFNVTVSLGEIPEEEKPGAPTNLVAEPLSDSTVRLTWDPVEGALGYGILVYGEPLGVTLETTAIISELTPYTDYCFTVVSIIKVDENNFPEEISEQSNEACVMTMGVEELASSFNIYPNPVENELFIETEMNVEEIAIYDVYGRQTMCQQVNETTSQQVVDVADLKAGVYFVKIIAGNGEVVKRFVKK